ncbi:hypothetical protein N1851_031498 [Merluccius polli]|uniref:Uncharacterized protein n=1 Tax=Merluccius polli TaxID=89951 RepID=A0AA47M3Z3_MERPO|nr:hypothetical protein N1851_031498 [Merluccius polli]
MQADLRKQLKFPEEITHTSLSGGRANLLTVATGGKKRRPAPLGVHMSHGMREETTAVRDVTQRLPRVRVPQSGDPDASRRQSSSKSRLWSGPDIAATRVKILCFLHCKQRSKCPTPPLPVCVPSSP